MDGGDAVLHSSRHTRGTMSSRLGALRIRQQVGAIREGAAYWRRRNRPATAAELERVAGFLETLASDMPFALPTGGSGTRGGDGGARAK